jgi:hypothetical protein
LFIQVLEIWILDYALVVFVVSNKMEVAMRFLFENIFGAAAEVHSSINASGIETLIVEPSPHLTDLLKSNYYLPEAVIVQKILNKGHEFVGKSNEKYYLWWRQNVLWSLYWMPSELVEALVSVIAAFLVTFLLFMYLFVLLPVDVTSVGMVGVGGANGVSVGMVCGTRYSVSEANRSGTCPFSGFDRTIKCDHASASPIGCDRGRRRR